MKAALLLPPSYDLTMIRQARGLASAILASRPLAAPIDQVVIGLPQGDEERWRRHERELRGDRSDIIVRHLRWEQIPAKKAKRMFARSKRQIQLHGIEHVVLPRDWGANFTDCGLWLNFADPALGAIYPFRPMAHICFDFGARYYPSAYANSNSPLFWQRQAEAFCLWRQNGIVLASSSNLLEAATSYAGVYPDSVMLSSAFIPKLDFDDGADLTRKRHRLLWMVEPNERYGFRDAVRGLAQYLSDGGRLEPLIVTAALSDTFAADSNHALAGEALLPLRDVIGRVPVRRVDTTKGLKREIQRAVCLWSSRLAGGDGAVVLDGVAAGIRTLIVDNPENRSAATRAGALATFYSPTDSENIADSLHQLEQAITIAIPPALVSASHGSSALQAGFVIDRLQELIDD